MKLLLLFAVVVVADPAAFVQKEWQNFRLSHGKTYKSLLEEKKRFLIFQSNVRTMEDHNAKFAKGEVPYSMGINQFSDLTDEELAETLTPMPAKPLGMPRKRFNGTGIVTGGEINWVTKGVVSSVKNQRSCGCCWAFSTVGAIEGQVAKSGKSLVSLSAQNLVDCSTENHGCYGGFMPSAFEYVIKNGVLTDAEYPFCEIQMECRQTGGQKISSYVIINDNEEDLLQALATVGPISVAMNANANLFKYKTGMFDASSGCTDSLNHGVLLVGAGTESGRDYWLIKNSWGEQFGQDGYFKLARNERACGIWKMNTYPVL